MEHLPRKTILPSGVRVLSETLPHVSSVSIGVWIATGSKHEPPGLGGVSHFIEHMVFKGTARRTTYEIALSLESVGGSLDAFTSRELTCFSARILPEHLPLAVDVLADLTGSPLFEAGQMELEKQVVIDEIRGFEDDPEDMAHDYLARALLAGHPLASPILGSAAEVGGLKRDALCAYFGERYRSGHAVVTAAGAVEHDDLLRLVEEHLRLAPGAAPDGGEGTLGESPRLVHLQREEVQEYICLGTRAVSYRHPDRYPMLVLTTLMGGGMSSRLFQRVREEHGLAYSVYCYLDCFAETGLWATGLSLQPDWTERALEVILAEFRRLLADGPAAAELAGAKAQLKGSTLLGMESTANRMGRLARSELGFGRVIPLEEVVARIEGVTTDDVMRVAGELLDPARMSLVLVGPREAIALDSIAR